MGNLNWSQLIPILLVVGLSGLSWIFNQLQKQAAKKAQLEKRRKYEEEMLRTGQPIQATAGAETLQVATDARETLRRTQLEELRRRARARTSGPQGPIILIPGSTGPIVLQPGPRRPSTRPQAPARGTPAARPQARPAKPALTPQQRAELKRRQAQAQQSAEPSRKQPKPKAVPSREQPEFTHRTVPDAQPETPASRRGEVIPVIGAGMSAADWRRAIIARELLSPPLALRDDDGAVSLPF